MMPSRPGRVRAALFVDFDNVFLSLEAVDPRAAKRFAEQPGRWMHWLERGYHTTGGGREGRTRRTLLMRNCYLNPATFSRFRGFFTRSAFSVIDCPPLTGGGKSGTDIYMAIDIIDALNHVTPFDEFIILSADADFTPVLLRLRAHDRRTAILANAVVAPALTAACSYTIEQSVFIESALGDASAGGAGVPGSPEGARPFSPSPRPFTPRPSLTGDYSVLPEVAAVLHESIEQDGPIPAAELPHFFFRFANFRNSDWFGFRSLRRLAEALTTVDPMLECGEPGEEWQMSLREAPLEPASPESFEFEAPAEAGQGSEGLPALIETIHHLVGIPALDPDGFDLIFEHMAKLFDEGVTDRAAMSRLLQERAGEEGMPLPRDAAEFVTAGLWQSGFDVASDASDPDVVAKAFRDYIVVRCEQAQRPLSAEELTLVDEWLVGA